MGLFDLKDKTDSEEEFDRLLENIAVDFSGDKPDYSELTIEQVDTVPGDELVGAVCQWIERKLADGEEDGLLRVDTLEGLPEPCGYVYAIKRLMDEFEKNGFNRFYSTEENAELAPFAADGFRALGEYDLVELCERSKVAYEKLLRKYGDEYFSEFLLGYGNNALTDLDFEFETLIKKKDLELELINYIRRNSDDFGD